MTQVHPSMKLHLGVDGQSGLAHGAVVTAANVHDKLPLPDLLHSNQQRVYGDSAYASQKELIASKAPYAKNYWNMRQEGGVTSRSNNPPKATNWCQFALDFTIRRCTVLVPTRCSYLFTIALVPREFLMGGDHYLCGAPRTTGNTDRSHVVVKFFRTHQ